MRLSWRVWLFGALCLIGVWLLYQAYPFLLFKVTEWQRSFNLQLSGALNSLKANEKEAGLLLVGVSFLYGIFHALGPGHGKFILTGYLSFEQTKLPQAIRLTLLSALVQGVVAIALVSIIVVAFTLSRSYFNLTLQWIERGSFALMLLFGLYWIYQSRRLFFLPRKRGKIRKILQISPQNRPLAATHSTHHCHSADCGCGHKHLPSADELQTATSWKAQWLLIFSIGLRPCSGAVLVLFLAYTLDLYLWGVLSALLMAVGTGLTLSLFACLVLFTRHKAITLGKWYLSIPNGEKFGLGLKLLTGVVIVVMAVILLHSSWLVSTPNLLFKR